MESPWDQIDSFNLDQQLVTNGCAGAKVTLFHPNGKESKSGQCYSSPDSVLSVPQKKICKLELIIHEALQREERLHKKLEELKLIVGKLEIACAETFTDRREEARLSSEIESLEKQTMIMDKFMSDVEGKDPEKMKGIMRQLSAVTEKIEYVAWEVQERQHRKLLGSVQRLVDAQRMASNLKLEVTALVEQASLSESHLEEMGLKCSNYCQMIEILKRNFQAETELTQQLEAHLARCDDIDFKFNLSESNSVDKFHNLGDLSDDDVESEKQDSLLECCKNYEESEEKDFFDENDETDWLMRELQNLLSEVDSLKTNLEKLYRKKQVLILQLETLRLPVEENGKTRNELDKKNLETEKSVILDSLSSESISDVETELKQHEDSSSREQLKQKGFDERCPKLLYELKNSLKRCEKLKIESCNLNSLLRSHLKSLEDSPSFFPREIVEVVLEKSELENGEGQELIKTPKGRDQVVNKESQTPTTETVSSSINADFVETNFPKSKPYQEENIENIGPDGIVKKSEFAMVSKSLIKGLTTKILSSENSSVSDSNERVVKRRMSENEENFLRNEWLNQNIGTWKRIQKIQKMFTSESSNGLTFSSTHVNEIKNLVDLITEDFVRLLLREQQINLDRQNLERELENLRYLKKILFPMY